MTKLHELLAVESNLRGQAEATRTDLKNTFEKKRNHFSEMIQTFHPSAEGAEAVTEGKLTIQTTVPKELAWITEKLANAMDVAHQVDMANLVANSDVTMEDGTILLTAVPATSLLQLEKRIKEIQDLVVAIPTLDPAKDFTADEDKGAGVFRAREVRKERTSKVFDYVVMVQPTDKHPAQVKELMVDKPVGTIVQQEWSSLLTVSQKGDMLDRVENLLRAVKKARSRANSVEVDVSANKIGEKLLDYVFRGA